MRIPFAAFFSLLLTASLTAQTKVTVNFEKPAYYPLLKSKGSVFQEGLPNEPTLKKAMSPLSDLEVSVFRPLVNQRSTDLISKKGGQVKVAHSTAYQTFIDLCHGNHISPMLTLYQTPKDFRAKGGRGKEPPYDLAGYSEGIERFVNQYQDSKPIYWEVWNEPQNGKNFLISNDVITDYNAIYSAVAPRISQGDPDALIVGPAMANSLNIINDFSKAFVDNVKTNQLPLDYFSVHCYNRFKGRIDRLDSLINVVRRNMGKDFQTVPLVLTEYEHFPSGSNSESKQMPRITTEGAIKWLVDLNYFLEQTDIPFVTWNRYLWKHEGGRPGGLIDYKQRKRPIYHAYKIFGEMPTERKELAITNQAGGKGIGGFASADLDRAGILLWNDSETTQEIQLAASFLPFSEGTVSLFRIDENNSSYLENSDSDELSQLESYELNELNNLAITIPGPGIVYLKITSDSNESKIETVNAKYIRSWEYTPRTSNGKVTGDYGNFNWKNWTGRIGVKGEKGIGLCGVTLKEAPEAASFQFKTFNTNPKDDPNALIGIRIDYLLDGAATKSVLIHGDVFNADRTTKLPWGSEISSADIIIDKGELLGNNELFDFQIEKYAPKKWVKSERRLIISFWMENTGANSQGVGRILAVEKDKT